MIGSERRWTLPASSYATSPARRAVTASRLPFRVRTPRHKRAGLDIGAADGVETGLITGSVEIDAIQAIVQRAKPEWRAGDPVRLHKDFLAALRGIVATSAISHGVDIERLNVIVFAGLPSDVAEYVQASSRVGRTHVGASILVPTPQRVRDVHVVGIHDIFHRFLERMISPRPRPLG